MVIKQVNRKIKFDCPERQESSSYKCQYGDKNQFDILQIAISYGNETRIYEIESKYLKENSKSIHFDAYKTSNSFEVTWKPQIVIPHIIRKS